jgi:hypothetical protein
MESAEPVPLFAVPGNGVPFNTAVYVTPVCEPSNPTVTPGAPLLQKLPPPVVWKSSGETVTVSGAVVALHPFDPVTVQKRSPLEVAVMLCVVAPLSHK